MVFEAILKERKRYEKNRSRRKRCFQDLDFICCSSYGRPRSKGFHWSHYKALLKKAGLPEEDAAAEALEGVGDIREYLNFDEDG